MALQRPFLVFLGDSKDIREAKTAFGVVQWRPEWCIGQHRMPGCGHDLGLPDLTIGEAAGAGARTLLIGLSTAGGLFRPQWLPTLLEAIAAGLDIAAGLHDCLGAVPELAEAARRRGVTLHDIRHHRGPFPPATLAPRRGRRLLTVGTDQNLGKKYTALAIERELRRRGIDADFRATGQTGIMISGHGIPLDALTGASAIGAVEALTPASHDDHWDVIEGQGCVLSPATSASPALVVGAAAQAYVLCHEPTRTHMNGLPHVPIPAIGAVMDAVRAIGRGVSPDGRFVGISVNTSALGAEEARTLLDALSEEFGMPATDPIRFGAEPIVDALLRDFPTRSRPDGAAAP
ncbi:DUF1611 domain-containing protein [Arenibaculum pallidiluteum]|uniref:DUF1611 domain-containing protein n=1 Tax=Arenibaculum pallidiluteum TaxID=2812559 RepID=UPI001A97374B|nr:DUF1611 domain-containing protein [Arenibaculum pallidiluteum]